MERLEVAGLSLDVEMRGSGAPILYLHAENYYAEQTPLVAHLAERGEVFIPRHPGFDGRTPPSAFRRVADLAYLYLDLLDQLDLHEVTVVGSSLGGWIALEMAVRGCARANSLILLSPLGVKFGEREQREYTDIFALPDLEAAQALFCADGPDLGTFSDEAMTEVARDRQYLAYYAWRPFLHNPGLARWLHRVTLPSVVLWGAEDGLVSAEHGRRLAARLPRAAFEVVAAAGHYPHLERLEATLAGLAAGRKRLGIGGSESR